MATDAVKRVQEKLFRGGSSTPELSQPASPALTISIPKPPTVPAPMPKRDKPSDSSPKDPQLEETAETTDSRTYRQRLASTQGDEYIGVERYRLVQDGKKERHWKRWGPYLSDRQWVSIYLAIFLANRSF
jgi:hypothetical protein